MDGSNPFARNPHHHTTSSHDSATSNPHPSPRSMIRPPPAMFAHGLPPPTSHQHPIPRSPGNMGGPPPYPHHYGASSASPSTASGGMQEHLPPGEGAFTGSGMSPTHLTAQLSAQKRAYRQRRKDPSCDACRERKVKCDATETSSCSECHQRGVKCQFTKETNRRMSSIKQVQDLQSQLESARLRITDLSGQLTNGTSMQSSSGSSDRKALDLPEISPEAQKPRRPTRSGASYSLQHVQRNARIWGHGIYRPLTQNRQNVPNPSFYHQVHTQPPKATTDRLIGNYYSSIHAIAPVVNFEDFRRELDNAYSMRSFQRSSHLWTALFFAVLGCGALRKVDSNIKSARPDPEGQQYIDEAAKAFSLWTDDFTVDHARIALLISIYLHETGLKSASSTWLATAVRVSVDLGLHHPEEPSANSPPDPIMTVWWSIYTWDRLCCLENGRPMHISDDECEIAFFKQSVDDRFIIPPQMPGVFVNTPQITFWNQIMLTWVVRSIGSLRKTLISRTTSIDTRTLHEYDDHFAKMLSQVPEPFHTHSSQSLDPSSLFSALTLQSARLHLYRLKVSSAQYGERIEALNRCRDVASETANYIKRSQSFSGYGSQDAQIQQWSANLAASAPSMLCTHLWRCILFLCFKLDFATALVCLRASAAIGEIHPINIACGRNIWFFLKMLPDRIASGQELEQDDEMLAYAAGDMQGSPETAWIWSGQEAAVKATAPAADSPIDQTHPNQPRSTSLLSDNEIREWKGWSMVESKMIELLEQQKSRASTRPASRHHPHPQESSPVEPLHPPSTTYYPPPHNPHKRLHLEPPSAGVIVPQPTSLTQPSPISSTASPSTASRISIANII